MKSGAPQYDLFGATTDVVEPAPVAAEDRELAAALPAGLRLGTMSWSYPGWRGQVYAAGASPKRLAAHGLSAYAQHPLLGAVEIDRSYYDPLSAHDLRGFADQVPDDFRFLVKAHEDCSVARYPLHARYGKRRGEQNPRYLDPAYAIDAVIGPIVDGLGSKLGAVLFQFPPHDADAPERFARELRGFLERLPKGVVYAIELRNAELLTDSYAATLADSGAVHCHNVWSAMPPLLGQVRRVSPRARSPLIVRWLLRAGDRYAGALARAAPFDRLIGEDPENRAAVAHLVVQAARHQVPTLVLVDNKAEGCAPESIRRLARGIVDKGR